MGIQQGGNGDMVKKMGINLTSDSLEVKIGQKLDVEPHLTVFLPFKHTQFRPVHPKIFNHPYPHYWGFVYLCPRLTKTEKKYGLRN